MIKFINRYTNGEMWVADDRKEKYLEAGHKLASNNSIETTKAPEEVINPPVESEEEKTEDETTKRVGRPKKKRLS